MSDNRYTYIIVFIATIAILGSGYLIYDDSPIADPVKAKSKQIGRVIRVTQDFRRRIAHKAVWENPKKSDLIYDGDFLFTGPNSNSKIEFNEGTAIELQPDTLLSIRLQEKYPQSEMWLDLSFGAAQVAVAGRTVVYAFNAKQAKQLRGPDILWQIEKPENHPFQAKKIGSLTPSPVVTPTPSHQLPSTSGQGEK